MCYSCVDANNVSEVVSIESDTISVLEESNDILIPLDGLKYDTYLLLSPDDEFVVAMNDIALDRKVSEMYKNAETTNEFIQVANFDLEQWKVELEYEVEAIQNDLSDEEKEIFTAAQESWNQFVLKDIKFDNECKRIHNYNGSMQSYQSLIEEARLYRERTIKVKYMHYLIELDLSKTTYNSLKFIFK